MATLRQLLQRTRQNLLILQEREAKFGGNAPLELLNQIRDHQTAVELIEDALNTELTETGLQQLKEALRPLLVAGNVEQINLDELKLEKPLLPYEPETVPVPAGPFLMGSEPGPDVPAEETPRHQLSLPAFRIGVYPVTNAQYAEFIRRVQRQDVPRKAGWYLREPPEDRLDHPVVGVSWHDAQAYCAWLSQQTGRAYRLPTEAEWEKAASWTGQDGPKAKRPFPWGDLFDAARCNTAEAGIGDTTPVGAYSPQGDSPCGCADMAGNVQEWTSTLWGSDVKKTAFPYPYQTNDGREDPAADRHFVRVYRIHRGGSFRDDYLKVRCTARGHSDPDSKIRWRGFRVVLES